MRYLSRIYFITIALLILFACSESDNPVNSESDKPKAVETSVKWEINKTDNNHIIGIPLESAPTFMGKSMENGDKIGVFYELNNELKCGGFSIWTGEESISVTAWGDDNHSELKDGFSPNEKFKWRIFKKSDNKTYDAEVTYKRGDESYKMNGVTVLEALSVR